MLTGKQYRYKGRPDSCTYRVLYVTAAGAFVEYEYNGTITVGAVPVEYYDRYEEYAAPFKPFRIRTVVAQNTVTGGMRVASIMDNYEPHRVDDPTWPTGWGVGNERRVYDGITVVSEEKK